MPRVNADATVIIFDVGKTSGTIDTKNGPTFFETARKCIARIVERKIFSRPKDDVAIILLGSKGTKNNLADRCGGDSYRHIEVLAPLSSPAWDMIKILPEKPTKYEGDWFEALLVAADLLKNEVDSKKVSNKKIVLMTDFKSEAIFDDTAEKVMAGFQLEKIELDIIGPDLLDDSEEKNKTETQVMNEKVAKSFIEATNGIATTFEEAISYLNFHKKKQTNPMPWNTDLSIGPNIKIPIAGYGRIREDQVLGRWTYALKDIDTGAASKTIAINKKKEYSKLEDNSTVDQHDIISGYEYGQSVIPFTELDKSMNYESGPRSLILYGFTKTSNVTWQNLMGNGVTYIVGRKGDRNAESTIRTLAVCMKECNVVGIARRVYNTNNAPLMHALFPVIDADFFGLSMVGLVFEDNIVDMSFPRITGGRYDPNDLQVEAFKELIDCMDLTKAYDDSEDTEAFPVGETVNPCLQYMLDCMAYRALNPNKPLPPPRDEIIELLQVPPKIAKASKGPIENLKSLFTFKPRKEKTKKRKADTIQNIGDSVTAVDYHDDDDDAMDTTIVDIPNITKKDGSEVITNIGTVDPVADFEALLKQDKKLKDLSEEMCGMIENLLYLSFDEDYAKPLKAMKRFREECVKIDPSLYNDWLAKLKPILAERRRINFLDTLAKDNLELITKEETALSNITDQDIQKFNDVLHFDTNNTTQVTIGSEDEDYFDDL